MTANRIRGNADAIEFQPNLLRISYSFAADSAPLSEFRKQSR